MANGYDGIEFSGAKVDGMTFKDNTFHSLVLTELHLAEMIREKRMSINKKSSRRISVRDDNYIWTVSPGSGYIIMIAEHEITRGIRLEVYVESDIDSAWVNFPNTEHLNMKIVRPSDVEYFICQALDQGWTPKVKGRPVVFDFDGKFLKRRLS